MTSGKPIYFGVKFQGHEAQKIQFCVGLQTEGSIDACCVRKLRWVFPAAVSRPTGFPCVQLFAVSQPAAKKWLSWVMASVGAAFF